MVSLKFRLEFYWKCEGNINWYLGVSIYRDIRSLKEDILDQWNNLDEPYWKYLSVLISRREERWIKRNRGSAGYYIW